MSDSKQQSPTLVEKENEEAPEKKYRPNVTIQVPQRIIIDQYTFAQYGSAESVLSHAESLSRSSSPLTDSPETPKTQESPSLSNSSYGTICRIIKKYTKKYFGWDEKKHARPIATSMFGVLLIYSYAKYRSIRRRSETKQWLRRDIALASLFSFLKNALGQQIRTNQRNLFSLLAFSIGQTLAAKIAGRSARVLSEDFLFVTSSFLYLFFFFG